MKKLVPILIIVVWISTTFLLISRYAPSSGLDTERQSLLPENKQRWMGIYLKGKKIGFSSHRFYKERDGYTVHEEIHIKLKVLDTIQDIQSKTEVSLSPDLKVNSFRFALNASQDIKIEGNIHNKNLILDITTESNKSRREIMLDEIPQMPLTILPYLYKKGLNKGTTLNFPVFDPVTLSIQKMYTEVVGKEKITLNGTEFEAYKIRGTLNGIHLLMWIDEHGNELKEESPLGFTLITEPRVKAVQLPTSSSEVSDLIIQTSVPFNLKLPDEISYLKIRVSGIDFDGLALNGGRQTLHGDIIEIVKEDIVTHHDTSLPMPAMEHFLEETPFIQSKNPEIAELASNIIGGEKNPLSAGRLLWEWVFHHIEKTPSITIPNAVDVLKTRKGDCNEHTALYTALARSAGLPTRINVGLVYKNGYFYYHAWPEIYTGRWIAIDPTLGEFPASAAHVRLITGDLDKQVILAKVVNQISLEGIEYR
ncbi:MAG: hypothetical protein KAI96_01140 [Thermodesulfovibrionia bacterium]|nr:hypothetical protein [Thermodesulfovibrionia bacterium]